MDTHTISEYRRYTSSGLNVAEEDLLWEQAYCKDENEKAIIFDELEKIHQVMRERENYVPKKVRPFRTYGNPIIDDAYEGNADLYWSDQY